MEHVVFYPSPDAVPAYHRFSSLDEAVRFVEHLRNVEGVVDVSVHQLTPVPLAFRAYYKVEVPAADVPAEAFVPEQPATDVPATDVPAVEVAAAAEPVPADVPPVDVEAAAPAEVDAEVSGKRSLGFFAH